MDVYTVYIRHPFTMLLAGPTGSGKTYWLKQLINNRNIVTYPPPKFITYYYGEWQSMFDTMKGVNFVQGMPHTISEDIGVPQWIIIDDLMSESVSSNMVSELFTKGSHHRNLSVILLMQNFFVQGKQARTVSINSQYIVLFKNPRNKQLASFLGRQIFPNKSSQFQHVFEDATSKPYSYLFIDLKSDTPEQLRLLANVFNENGQNAVVYSI